MALTRDAILAHAGSFKKHEVHVPAWAGSDGDDVVFVRAITSREWDTHQSLVDRDNKKRDNASALLLSRVIVDEEGRRLFTDADADQIGELGVAEITRVSREVLIASGLLEADESGDGDESSTEEKGDAATGGDSSSS